MAQTQTTTFAYSDQRKGKEKECLCIFSNILELPSFEQQNIGYSGI